MEALGMSELAQRYLELLNEMEWHRVTSELTRAQEIEFAGKLDLLWRKLTEDDQEAVERELSLLDGSDEDDGFLGADTDLSAGSTEGPRRAA
jgi:hypothetical protein